jgi:2-C-methyl-D-erythritol 4-phosphate cytidylyltransferase
MGSFRPQQSEIQPAGRFDVTRHRGDVGAVVLAAGSGNRFGAEKQFLELLPGERLVDRAVRTVAEVAEWTVVVLPPGHIWDGDEVYATVAGDSDRLGSVRAGIGALPDACSIVLVHDAAHPLATAELSARCTAEVAGGAAAAVPFLEAVDVVKRRSEAGRLSTVGRAGLGAAQVPMAFRRDVLAAAHQLDRSVDVGAVAEDSHLIELAGHLVQAVEGDVANIHVTDPRSLDIARRLAGTLDPTAPTATVHPEDPT